MKQVQINGNPVKATAITIQVEREGDSSLTNCKITFASECFVQGVGRVQKGGSSLGMEQIDQALFGQLATLLEQIYLDPQNVEQIQGSVLVDL